jgi:hypothetical protein
VDRLTVGLVTGFRAEGEQRVAEGDDDDREDDRRQHDHDVQQVVDLRRGGRILRPVPVEGQHDRREDRRERNDRCGHLGYGEAVREQRGRHSIEAAAGRFARSSRGRH